MPRPTTGDLRLLRSAVVTLVIVGLAAAGHVGGGGGVPSGLAAVAVVVLVALVVHTLTRWRLSTPAILGLLAGGQLVLHQAFMALDSAALADLPVGAAAHGHPVAATTTVDLHADLLHSGLSTPMLLAHVVATLLTAAALACGERALWRLWAWLSPLVQVLLTPSAPVEVRLPRAARSAFHRRASRGVVLAARGSSRRGPPVGLLPV